MIKIYQRALLIAGTVFFLAAIIHGVWHWYLPTYQALQSMPAVQMSTMQLMNAAISMFLFFMAISTFIVATSDSLDIKNIKLFTKMLIGFWAGRFILELIMPIQIPLIFIHEPGVLAKVIMCAPVIILSIPFLFSKKE